jgi:alpha-beta hydrolase superfamily lysophospholipase
MLHPDDFSTLDRPEILQFIFPVVYSNIDFELPRYKSLYAATHYIEVEQSIKIGCKYFAADKDYPSILYFHGNGETILDQDWIASLYNRRGINLFMTDYRGYGVSDGKPTITNLLLDCHKIYKGFREIVKREGFNPDIFVMGRSLGSIPAVEISYHHQKEIRGLIIESGSARNFSFLLNYLNPDEQKMLIATYQNKDKIRSISLPTLIIHGELDEIIPLREGEALFENSAATDKSILIIPGSGHNDLLLNGEKQYFSVIGDFVNKYA